MATWKELITRELEDNWETWNDIESITLSDDELAAEFDNDYGGVEGKPFTAWTAKRVYFPVEYDGAEWVTSVSRVPNGQPTYHVG